MMTAKTLEKVPVSLGGYVHPVSDTIYSVDHDSLPPGVAIFPNADLGGHYHDHLSGAPGKLGLYMLLF